MDQQKKDSDAAFDVLKNLIGNIQKLQQQQQPPMRPVGQGRYHRLVAWLKRNYGSEFKDGSTTADVQRELESIYKQLEAKGDFKDNPQTVKGWRAYIDGRQYGDLVKVTDAPKIASGEEAKIVCPQCGKSSTGGKFCAYCRAPLDKRVCPKCGAQNLVSAKFCNNCGNKLG